MAFSRNLPPKDKNLSHFNMSFYEGQISTTILLHNCNMLHNCNTLYPGIVHSQSKTVFKKNFVFYPLTGYKLKKIVIPTLIRSFLYPRSKHEKGTNLKNGYFIDFLFLFQGTNCIKSYILHQFLQGTKALTGVARMDFLF